MENEMIRRQMKKDIYINLKTFSFKNKMFISKEKQLTIIYAIDY